VFEHVRVGRPALHLVEHGELALQQRLVAPGQVAEHVVDALADPGLVDRGPDGGLPHGVDRLAHLWRLRQEPAFLVKVLREELGNLKDAGLANLLARGDVGGVPGMADPPPDGSLPSRRLTALASARACGWYGGRQARGKPGCSGPLSATCWPTGNACCWSPGPTS